MGAKPEWIGLGTAIERATRRLGLSSCAKCRGRRQALDRAVPRVWKSGSVSRPNWMRRGALPVQPPSGDE